MLSRTIFLYHSFQRSGLMHTNNKINVSYNKYMIKQIMYLHWCMSYSREIFYLMTVSDCIRSFKADGSVYRFQFEYRDLFQFF